MSLADTLRLLTLGAIWGASFLFMRVAAPVLGAAWVADLRVLIAGIALWLYARAIGESTFLRERWVAYSLIGITNSAFPFVMYAFAAMTLPASSLSVINATSPLFGALFATIWLKERLTVGKWLGCAVGFCGVALLLGGLDLHTDGSGTLPWAIAAGLPAAASYGVATIVTRKWAGDATPLAASTGSQLTSAVMLWPLLPFNPPLAEPTLAVALAVLAMALLSSSLGYLLYFRLLTNIGPVKTLTVTFLSPVFGIIWGALVLGERLTFQMAIGAALVLMSIYLVTRR